MTSSPACTLINTRMRGLLLPASADPTGDLYTALGFSPGFAPDATISPYAKLLPMLAGIGSPGTIQEVLRGYIGDRSAKPVFASGGGSGGGSNLFDVLGRVSGVVAWPQMRGLLMAHGCSTALTMVRPGVLGPTTNPVLGCRATSGPLSWRRCGCRTCSWCCHTVSLSRLVCQGYQHPA
jgi:hypothetical protein